MDVRDVIHDWNQEGGGSALPTVEVHDETLRDGLQSPSVRDPDIDQKLAIVRLLAQVGVDSADVGLPGAGPRAFQDVERIARLVAEEKLPLRVCAAGRTHPNDIRPMAEISQKVGIPVEAMLFLGSSPIRMYAENWEEDRLESLTREAMRMSVHAGLPTSFVTEDTTRAKPSTLRRLFTAAIEEGATRLVLCDTVGHVTPRGVHQLFAWTNALLDELGVRGKVLLDWHGHDDRGLALINTIAAIEAGAQRVHGTVMGIGERVGNTSLDHLLVNLKLWDGRITDSGADLHALGGLVRLVSEAVGREIPLAYPVFGEDAFMTGTGVHAAAVIKAQRKGDHWLADRVYSGVPAGWFGLKQGIGVGPMSGESNVRWFLEDRGLPVTAEVVRAVLDAAKGHKALLSEAEIREVVGRASSASSTEA